MSRNGPTCRVVAISRQWKNLNSSRPTFVAFSGACGSEFVKESPLCGMRSAFRDGTAAGDEEGRSGSTPALRHRIGSGRGRIKTQKHQVLDPLCSVRVVKARVVRLTWLRLAQWRASWTQLTLPNPMLKTSYWRYRSNWHGDHSLFASAQSAARPLDLSIACYTLQKRYGTEHDSL